MSEVINPIFQKVIDHCHPAIVISNMNEEYIEIDINDVDYEKLFLAIASEEALVLSEYLHDDAVLLNTEEKMLLYFVSWALFREEETIRIYAPDIEFYTKNKNLLFLQIRSMIKNRLLVYSPYMPQRFYGIFEGSLERLIPYLRTSMPLESLNVNLYANLMAISFGSSLKEIAKRMHADEQAVKGYIWQYLCLGYIRLYI